jgi:hypothetical protein
MAMEELELSSLDADELSGRDESLDSAELSTESGFSVSAELLGVSELSAVAELSVESELSIPLLLEEISSLSCPLVLFTLVLSSQAASVKASTAAASPQVIFVRCFMVILLIKVLSICS